MHPEPQFDVFVSYSHRDVDWVRMLTAALSERGLRVWLDRDQVRPGTPLPSALEEGLATCRAVVFVVSPDSMASGWAREEFHHALVLSQAQGRDLRLIPVVCAGAEPVGFMASRAWVDFRDGAAFSESVDRLVFGITGAAPAEGPDALQERVFVGPEGEAPVAAALEFFEAADDGKDLARLVDADVVVLGVSRSGLSTLAAFLARRGYLVANVPVLLEVDPPISVLKRLDVRRVFVLYVSPGTINHRRRQRLRGVDLPSYALMERVVEEVERLRGLCADHPEWNVVDTTNLSPAETAERVLEVLSAKTQD